MNVGQLKELVSRLLTSEGELKMLQDLKELESSLQSLVANPASAEDQKEVRSDLDTLDGTSRPSPKVFRHRIMARFRAAEDPTCLVRGEQIQEGSSVKAEERRDRVCLY